MSTPMVTIHELIAWDLDDYSYRSSGSDLSEMAFAKKLADARSVLAQRNCDEPGSALVDCDEDVEIKRLLAAYTKRPDLHQEYEGLDWALGVVDLRCLLAFQRRLVFDTGLQRLQPPQQEDWSALFSFSLGTARDTKYSMTIHRGEESSEFLLHSNNPDLQLRQISSSKDGGLPFVLYGGSPFFEVAEFRERWFLRDGYHRAYRLLQAGVHHVPAVIIRARALEEVGATRPWFFNEHQLFSVRPPRVIDFLDDDLVLSYKRRRFIKTIRINIEETLELAE